MNFLLQSAGFGIVTGSVLAIAAVGATVQTGLTNFVNFAYGDFMTFGAYIGLIALTWLHWGLVPALLLAAAVTAAMALIVNRVVFRPFMQRKARVVTMTVVTVGLSLLISGGLEIVFGANLQTYNLTVSHVLAFGPFLLTTEQLAIVACAVAVLVALEIGLYRTRIGKGLRAMSQNGELAAASAINVKALTDIAWAISGGLAGVAGVVLVMQVGVLTPSTGNSYLFLVMAPVIIGGIGRPLGTIVAALGLGLLLGIASAYTDAAYAEAIAFGVLVIVLLVRPSGIFAMVGRHT